MRLEPREQVPVWFAALAPLLAVAVSLAFCSLLVLWGGESAFEAFWLLFKGAFGSKFALSETLTRATPLILTGLAAAVAFRAKFWNIGGEGQFYCGALAATWVGTGMITLPPALMIPLLFVAGAMAGGLALYVPVVLKSRLKVDEVVTTLLLNFVILLLVSFLLEGPWKDPMSLGWPQAAPIIDEGTLPKLLAKTRLHLGLVIALAAALLMWLLMSHTVWGYEIRAVGHNPKAAAFAGISINATILRTAMISGGLAGMAGVAEIAGLKGYLTLDLSPGFGYAGIAAAMLAQLHPLGVVVAAIFLSGVFVGADSMSRAINIPNYIADVMVAVSLLLVLLSVMLVRYRIRRG
jgi:simple sugar transport system permease protein